MYPRGASEEGGRREGVAIFGMPGRLYHPKKGGIKGGEITIHCIYNKIKYVHTTHTQRERQR